MIEGDFLVFTLQHYYASTIALITIGAFLGYSLRILIDISNAKKRNYTKKRGF